MGQNTLKIKETTGIIANGETLNSWIKNNENKNLKEKTNYSLPVLSVFLIAMYYWFELPVWQILILVVIEQMTRVAMSCYIFVL